MNDEKINCSGFCIKFLLWIQLGMLWKIIEWANLLFVLISRRAFSRNCQVAHGCSSYAWLYDVVLLSVKHMEIFLIMDNLHLLSLCLCVLKWQQTWSFYMITLIKHNVRFSTFIKCTNLIFRVTFSAFSVPCYLNRKTIRKKS